MFCLVKKELFNSKVGVRTSQRAMDRLVLSSFNACLDCSIKINVIDSDTLDYPLFLQQDLQVTCS